MIKIICALIILPITLSAQLQYLDHRGNPHLWGNIEINDLESPPYNDWYQASKLSFEPKFSSIISDHLKGVTVKIYMGTWCGDSKRWVPKFKLLLRKWLLLREQSGHL